MPAEMPDPKIVVWFQNRFVPLAEANVNILTHALNYGTGVFEGIRGYYEEEQQELYLVRLREHFERWKNNCGVIRIDIPKSVEELCDITLDLCRRNRFRTNVYVRPLAYKASARIGVHADDNDAYALVMVPFGLYFGTEKGLSAAVVSWRRIKENAIPGRAKLSGAYVNSVLAGDEARRNGFDEAILLTETGHVSEGATCNLFMVRKNKLITPPLAEDILEGITRDSVIELARNELGIEVVERQIGRTELYMCEEVFLTGTAVEVAPIVNIDHRPVGSGEIGAITRKIQSAYVEATRGRLAAYQSWLTPAYHPVAEEMLA